jgi:hypothetical protein
LKVISVYYHQFSGKTQAVHMMAFSHAIHTACGPLYELTMNKIPLDYLTMEVLDLLIDRM